MEPIVFSSLDMKKTINASCRIIINERHDLEAQNSEMKRLVLNVQDCDIHLHIQGKCSRLNHT